MIEIEEQRFPTSAASIGFRREDERWEMALIIETDPVEDDADSPRLEVINLRLDVADWTALAGTRLAVREPASEDDQDQNIYWGAEFENVTGLELVFGAIDGETLEVEARGKSYRALITDTEETLVPFVARARCTVVLPPAPRATAEPPLGRKTCRACNAVSFEQALTCPACDAAGWWNP